MGEFGKGGKGVFQGGMDRGNRTAGLPEERSVKG